MAPFKVVHETAHSAVQIAVTWDAAAKRADVSKSLTDAWAAAMAEVEKRFDSALG